MCAGWSAASRATPAARRISQNRDLALVLLEHEAVHGAGADDEADDRPEKAHDEEDAPAPVGELLRRHQRLDEDHRAEAEQQPNRNGEPDPGAPEGAEFRARRLLDHPGRGGTELGAEADALAQAGTRSEAPARRRQCCRSSASARSPECSTPSAPAHRPSHPCGLAGRPCEPKMNAPTGRMMMPSP